MGESNTFTFYERLKYKRALPGSVCPTQLFKQSLTSRTAQQPRMLQTSLCVQNLLDLSTFSLVPHTLHNWILISFQWSSSKRLHTFMNFERSTKVIFFTSPDKFAGTAILLSLFLNQLSIMYSQSSIFASVKLTQTNKNDYGNGTNKNRLMARYKLSFKPGRNIYGYSICMLGNSNSSSTAKWFL